MVEHGGRLRWVASHYGIPLDQWVDLSTGINPNGWPVPEVPSAIWNRLPEEEDGLLAAAQDYYGSKEILPVAGSQAAIQLLPRLAPAGVVGVVSPTYGEHPHGWLTAGRSVVILSPHEVEESLQQIAVLVVVNPNNPTGQLWSRDQLLSWHASLAKRGGWLLVDEAFMDAQGEGSLTGAIPLSGLVVLRSLGKFFGLAGARVGFVLAEEAVLRVCQQKLGPWALANPSRWVATAALSDRSWQEMNREILQRDSQRLARLWQQHGLPPAGGTALFQWIPHGSARKVQEFMARRGIYLRAFDHPNSLRCGLPGNEDQWQRLQEALSQMEGV